MFETMDARGPEAMPLLARAPLRHHDHATSKTRQETAWQGPAPLSQARAASPSAGTPAAAPPAFKISTSADRIAADGSPGDRKTVGVGESVSLAASAPVFWSVSGGALKPTPPGIRTADAAWVAPGVAGSVTVTATPKGAAPASVTFTVIAPSRRRLDNIVPQQIYYPDRAGSGFIGVVTILPLHVSFEAVEVREGGGIGEATGYYKDVLHWDGNPHLPSPRWGQVQATHNILIGGLLGGDTVGTSRPGSPPPFSSGTFQWKIPQLYRLIGDAGEGTEYSIAVHSQSMFGESGLEATSKEGGFMIRMPALPPNWLRDRIRKLWP